MAVTHTRFGFKTGYLQKTDAYDVAVVSNEEGDVFKVGQLVTLTAAAGGVPAYITKKTTPALGDFIVAQSDMTMEYGHVPVELRDYRYSDEVAVTKKASAAVAGDKTKKVSLYQVIDVNDLVKM